MTNSVFWTSRGFSYGRTTATAVILKEGDSKGISIVAKDPQSPAFFEKELAEQFGFSKTDLEFISESMSEAANG